MIEKLLSLFKWRKKDVKPEIVEVVEEEVPTLDGYKFPLGRPPISGKSSSNPLPMSRSYGDRLRACDIKGCVRPSSVTIMTTDNLTVDIPDASKRNLIKPGKLAIYNEYRLCDRCYRDKIAGKSTGTPYVVSDLPLYNPDQHTQTQKKLAQARKKLATKAKKPQSK